MWGMVGLAIFLCGVSVAVSQASRALTLASAVCGSLVLLILALLTQVQVHFIRRREEEALAVEDYKRSHAGTELFADADEALKHVARTLRIYQSYVLPVLAIAVGVAIIVAGALLWRTFTAMPALPTIKHPLHYAWLSLFFFVICLVGGSFFAGASREAGCRWLRPAAGWLFFTGALFAISATVMLLVHFQVSILRLDVRAAKIGLGLNMLLAAELILGVIVELYRPRVPGEEERPILESRLLALFTEPGGVARNVAAALDYQFGFQVSDVWFYRFLERTLAMFVIAALLLGWLMTCFVVIKPEEQSIRVRLGKVVDRNPIPPSAWLPGNLHGKLPWPFETIVTFPVDHVQQIAIGYVPGDGKPAGPPTPDQEMDTTGGRVVVWTKAHNKEEMNFVVAMGTNRGPETGVDAEGALPVSVSFLAASIPLYFKVTDLYDYLFGHRDPVHALTEVATREVVSYLANADFQRLLAAGRADAAAALRASIQTAADSHKLGVEVVFVGLYGIHPPVRVGKAYEMVVNALEEQHSTVLNAEKGAIASLAQAQADARSRVTESQAYRNRKVQVAKAEADRFIKQMQSYTASPELYVLFTFLDLLENDAKDVRKYVVASDNSHEVLILNLEKKIRPDLLDLDVGDVKK